ncbi:MAG: ferrochelatase, partial [Nocardiopsaceae bacterium]|nr:ferrochelatase [Nocardiopsaceae bacterium]
EVRDAARLVFTAHSVPVGMAASSGSGSTGTVRPGVTTGRPGVTGGRYAAELNQASSLITEQIRRSSAGFDLVWQSRSGPPSVPWLEPDISDHLSALASRGVPAVVVVPVGFVSDHMEVVHDLDTEARAVAESLGLGFARAAAPGSSPRFARMVCELVADAESSAPVGCPEDCCRYVPKRRAS